MVINAFKSKILPMTPSGFDCDEDEIPRMSPDEEEIPRMSPNEDELSKQYDELFKAISNISNNSELIKKYFNKVSLLELFKFLRYSQNKATGGAKQGLIEANLFDLKKDIKNMSDDEVKNKIFDLIAYFVEKILNTVKTINHQEEQTDTTDMPELEDDKSAAQRQKGQGLKILKPK